jgi:hypothetical protein
VTFYVAPIVEGHTERECVEVVVRRIWFEFLGRLERLQVLEPFRRSRSALVHRNGLALRAAVQEAFLKLQAKERRDSEAHSLLLILLDAEGDCPATLAPRLLRTAHQARSDADITCVLAKRMIENWIAAGSSTLAGVNGLPDRLDPPENPEDFNGARWLDTQLRSVNPARKYAKTIDAKILVSAMDIRGSLAVAPSFDKLRRELEARVPPPPTARPDETP